MRPNILSKEQRSLLPIIKKFNKEFYLVGGTAIALYIGHRQSIDFDLFKKGDLNIISIFNTLDNVKLKYKIIHQDIDQLHIILNKVKVTFFKYCFNIPHTNKFNDIITMPALIDLAAMKAFAIGKRAKWKDYADMYFLLKYRFNINEISERATQIYQNLFSEKLLRQQLCYFKDIDYSEKIDYKIAKKPSDADIKTYLTNIALTKI